MTCSSSTTCSPERRDGQGRGWLAFVLAVLATPLALHSSPGLGERPASEALIDTARAALSRGDGVDSEMKLRAAMDRGASRREVAAWMGKAYLEQDDLDHAREWLASGDFSPGTAADGWRALGLLERLDGNLPASGTAYDKALALIPNDPSLWVEIGRLRYAGGEHLLAIQAAEHALWLGPDNVRALEFRGQLVRDRFGLLAAMPWFERAIRQDPKDVSVLLEYAATLGEMDRASEALAITRKILDLSPKNPRAYYLQAVIAARAGNYELARGLLARTRGELDQQSAVQMLHGVVEIAAGNSSAAEDALEALLRDRPDYRPAKDLLARAIYQSGDYRYLTLRFADDITRDAASPYLLTLVARAYEAMDDRQHAGELLDRSARPQVPSLRVLAGQGDIGELLAQGRATAAEAPAERARRSKPGFYDSQSLAGDVQLALGHAQAAQERYAAAAEIRMPESLFQRRLEAYAVAGDFNGAEGLVESYLRENPSSRVAWRAAARLAISVGDFDRADAILSWLRSAGSEADVQLLCDLAMVQAREGDVEAAQDTALAAYHLQRANPSATQALGYGYAMQGTRPAEARALLDKAQAMVGDGALIVEARRLLQAKPES